MNNLPNLITSVRLVAALMLICLCLGSAGHGAQYFLPLFVAAGVSDMLDGYIARRFNWCTEFGARLDSISDLLLYAAVALFLSVNTGPELAKCIFFLLVGALTQLFHWLLCLRKIGQFPAYHTTFSRICAYLIFAGTIDFWLLRSPEIMALLMLAWTACSCEGIAITLVLKRPMSNLPSIRAALSVR